MEKTDKTEKRVSTSLAFGAGIIVGLFFAGLGFLLFSNITTSEEENSTIVADELISDEELPILVEEEPPTSGTQENPFFETPEKMKQEEASAFIYKYVEKNNYTPKQKVEVLSNIFGGDYELEEETEETLIFESRDKNNLKTIVISDSALGYWAYYQQDTEIVSCTINGGEDVCPTDISEAEQKAKKIVENFIPKEEYIVNAYEGGGVYNIIVSPLLEGRESSPPFVLEYSPNGKLIYATGYFAVPERQYEIDILNPKVVLENLNSNIPWKIGLVEQTAIPTGEYESGDVNNRDSEDGTTVYIEEGTPSWKIYSMDQLEEVYLVPSYIFVASGKNRAWNVIAVEEEKLP